MDHQQKLKVNLTQKMPSNRASRDSAVEQARVRLQALDIFTGNLSVFQNRHMN